MFSPFKNAQARARRRIRKATATAIGQMAGALVPKLPKAKAGPKPKTTAKAVGRTRVQVKAGVTGATPRAQKPKPPTATVRSRMPVPRGASFGSRTYEGPNGNLEYKLYLPACAKTTAKPLPVLVMLHGCGQSPDDFASGTGMNALAEELGIIVVYPAQNRRVQPNRCWHWYRSKDQGREVGEPALLSGLTLEVLDLTSADPARVYVAGLSAGASMASILAATYPDIFAAVGIHSGLTRGAAHDAATAAFAMRHGAPGHRSLGPMPTIVFHGEEDKVVNIRNGRYAASRAIDAFVGLSRTETISRGGGGHPFVRQSHRRGKGRSFTELWVIKDAGHAWSGGSRSGRFADPDGPDASREFLRFVLQHRTTAKQRKAAKSARTV